MNLKFAPVILPACTCALLALAFWTTSPPVGSNGSDRRKAREHVVESELIKGYDVLGNTIQVAAYNAIHVVSVPGRLFAGAGTPLDYH